MNLEEDNEYEPNWEHIQTITTFDGINQCDSSECNLDLEYSQFSSKFF